MKKRIKCVKLENKETFRVYEKCANLSLFFRSNTHICDSFGNFDDA